MIMKTNSFKTSNRYILPIVGIAILIFSACESPVKVPEKLISDETAATMDYHLSNRTQGQIPTDDGLSFGYTYEELEEYMIYLKDVSKKKNILLDSVKFVIAAYPPNPERGNKVYTAIYLKPTFKKDKKLDNINKAQIGGNNEEETENHTEYNTILDMSGCCPSDEFIADQK